VLDIRFIQKNLHHASIETTARASTPKMIAGIVKFSVHDLEALFAPIPDVLTSPAYPADPQGLALGHDCRYIADDP